MKKFNRRVVAGTAAVALALGIFAAVPLSAEAKTNYKISKSAGFVGLSDDSFDSTFSALVNGL